MEEDLIVYYVSKIDNKLKIYCLQQQENLRNDLLMYLEICIEICNMLERKFSKSVNHERKLFQDIQSDILLRDTATAMTTVAKIKKELKK